MRGFAFLGLCWLFTLFPRTLPAQEHIPGYLGRKLMLEYSFAFSAPLNFDSTDTPSNFQGTKTGWPGSFYLRDHHFAGLNLCLSRRSMLGLQYLRFRSGYRSRYLSYAHNFQDTLAQIRAPGLGVQFRTFYFFTRGTIAPIGPFTEIAYRLYFPGLFNPGSGSDKPLMRKLYSSLCLQAGYTAALTNRILFSFGADIYAPVLNKALHPLTVRNENDGDGSIVYEAMTRNSRLNVRFSLQALLF